jgi:hypothetical protein
LKKIIFSLLLLCLLALPASAWQESFEGHSDDMSLSESDFNINDFAVASNDHGYTILKSVGSTAQTIIINQPFNNYLAYDIKYYTSSSNYACYMKVTFTNSSGDNSVYNLVSDLDTLGLNYNKRVELIENPGGTAFDLYIDGVFKNSFPYLNEGSVDGTGNITIEFKTSASTKTDYIWLDNFVGGSDYSIIGCDNEFTTLDSYQYYNFGFPIPVDAYMFCRVYAPNGTILQTENVSLATEYSIQKSLITEGGTYSIKLFQHDNLSGTNYFFASRNFIFDQPSGKSIILNKEQYSPSDQMEIFTYMPTYSSGHKVTISYKTPSGYTSYTYDVTSAEYTKNWVLPATAQWGSFFAYFRDANDNVVAYDNFEVTAPLGTTSLYLDKSTYENNDTVKISYKYLPDDSDISLQLKSGSTNVYTESWRDLSGSGVITFNISGRAADSIYVKAVKPVAGGTNTILKEATAKILSGNGFISGKIYDGSTNTPLSGATISIGGSETISDALGYYEMTTLMGTQPVHITCDGYKEYTGNVRIIYLSNNLNFYLVPEIAGNTLYGTVTDYYTGEPLNNTYIQIKNGSNVYGMLTHRTTGYYLFDQEGLEGTWDVTVTKTGYDTYTKSKIIENNTYLAIKLVPVGGASDIPEDVDEINYTKKKYGAYGRHAFDFDGDGKVSGEEWRYAFEHLIVLLGCLLFMGFISIVGRAGRR